MVLEVGLVVTSFLVTVLLFPWTAGVLLLVLALLTLVLLAPVLLTVAWRFTVGEEFLTALPRPLLAVATLELLLPESALLRARSSRTATLLSLRYIWALRFLSYLYSFPIAA